MYFIRNIIGATTLTVRREKKPDYGFSRRKRTRISADSVRKIPHFWGYFLRPRKFKAGRTFDRRHEDLYKRAIPRKHNDFEKSSNSENRIELRRQGKPTDLPNRPPRSVLLIALPFVNPQVAEELRKRAASRAVYLYIRFPLCSSRRRAVFRR